MHKFMTPSLRFSGLRFSGLRLSGLLAAATLLAAPLALADPAAVGRYKDWSVFTDTTGGETIFPIFSGNKEFCNDIPTDASVG